MSQREFYTLEIFSKMKPVLKQMFILHCFIEIVKFFCNCLFNVLHGEIKMTANVSQKELKRHEVNIDLLCEKKEQD